MDTLSSLFNDFEAQKLHENESILVSGGIGGSDHGAVLGTCDGSNCCKETEDTSTDDVCTGDKCDPDQNADYCL